jgi:hypothetical protein
MSEKASCGLLFVCVIEFVGGSAEVIFQRLNEGSSTEPPNMSFDFGVRRTFAMEPPTECMRHLYSMVAGSLAHLMLTNSTRESPTISASD